MHVPFFRTIRTLEGENHAISGAAVVTGLAVLAAWIVWMVVGNVAIYAVSTTARVEAIRVPRAVEAPSEGQLARLNVALGQHVRAGSILFELDATPETLTQEEEEERLRSLASEHEGLIRQIQAQRVALEEARRVARASAEKANTQRDSAEASARLAEAERIREQRLFEAGLLSDRELNRAIAEDERARALARQAALEAQTVFSEQQLKQAAQEAALEALTTQLARIEGQTEQNRIALRRARNEVTRRVVRATVDGTVGELAPLRQGTSLHQGQKLAVLVPDGQLHVVADFPAGVAAGRIRPGQRARMRLEGFSWTAYGAISAVVTAAASEPTDGLIRVELKSTATGPLIPMQHGLPGRVEVETERVSPAEFLLRNIGR